MIQSTIIYTSYVQRLTGTVLNVLFLCHSYKYSKSSLFRDKLWFDKKQHVLLNYGITELTSLTNCITIINTFFSPWRSYMIHTHVTTWLLEFVGISSFFRKLEPSINKIELTYKKIRTYFQFRFSPLVRILWFLSLLVKGSRHEFVIIWFFNQT